MIKKTELLFLVTFFTSSVLSAQKSTVWRGDGSGIYKETGLLKEWPADDPHILWYYDDPGAGFSSPAFVENMI